MKWDCWNSEYISIGRGYFASVSLMLNQIHTQKVGITGSAHSKSDCGSKKNNVSAFQLELSSDECTESGSLRKIHDHEPTLAVSLETGLFCEQEPALYKSETIANIANFWMRFCAYAADDDLISTSLYSDLKLDAEYQTIVSTGRKNRNFQASTSVYENKKIDLFQLINGMTLGQQLKEQLCFFLSELHQGTELSSHFWLEASKDYRLWKRVNSFNISRALQLFQQQYFANIDLGNVALDILKHPENLTTKCDKLGIFPIEKVKTYFSLKFGLKKEIESRTREWQLSMENQINRASSSRKLQIAEMVETSLLARYEKELFHFDHQRGSPYDSELNELVSEALKVVHAYLKKAGIIHKKLRPLEIFELDLRSWISPDIPSNFVR